MKVIKSVSIDKELVDFIKKYDISLTSFVNNRLKELMEKYKKLEE